MIRIEDIRDIINTAIRPQILSIPVDMKRGVATKVILGSRII